MSRERVWSGVCLAVSLCHRLRTHGKVYCCPCAVRVNSGERSYHSSHRDIAITFSRERARSRCEFTEIYAGYGVRRRGNSQMFTPNNGRSFGERARDRISWFRVASVVLTFTQAEFASTYAAVVELARGAHDRARALTAAVARRAARRGRRHSSA